MASTNPYVSSLTHVPLPNRNLKPQLQMAVFTGWCIVVLGVAAIILLPEPLISQYIDSIGEYGFFILISLPALYWEAFCRVSSRPISTTQSILSSSLRCGFIYGYGCLLTIFVLSGVTRTGPFQDDRSLSETRHVGVMILSASIVIGAALLAGYDFWRHKRQNKAIHAEPPTARLQMEDHPRRPGDRNRLPSSIDTMRFSTFALGDRVATRTLATLMSTRSAPAMQ